MESTSTLRPSSHHVVALPEGSNTQGIALKDQLQYLRTLQELDSDILEIRRNIEEVPAKLGPAKQDLAKLEAMLEAERSKIEETETWRKEQEGIIAREQEALKHANSKLSEAKNARDFNAASREIDNKKRSIHDRELEVMKVYEALETGREKLVAHENDVESLRQRIRDEEATFADELNALKVRAAEVEALRPEVAAKLDPDVLKRYEDVKRRRGIAVVAIVDGVCSGCHMKLPPQLANLIARGETIEACRQCNRLLYRPEDLESAEDTAEAS